MENISIKDLESAIKNCNKLYRAGEPIVSDKEYDNMVEQLRKLDPDNAWFQNIEPAPVANGRKRKLPIPMKSLDKVKNIRDIFAWMKSLDIENGDLIITPKFDGVSLLYDEYRHIAYSRGGAENEGQDCTAQYDKLKKLIYKPFSAYTFGEFVFSKKSWEENFKGKKSPESGDPYKSPRNTAAGFLNRDTASDDIKHVTFFRYGIDEYDAFKYGTYHNIIMNLCFQYGQPHLYEKINCNLITEEKLMELFLRWREKYYIDGLVLYINDIRIWEEAGRHQTSGNPLYAIAYKHPDFTESFETTVKNITWKAAKSGALKPVVNIDTVNTGDCEMENPTGYNASWIENMGIAKGAKILVTRSGGVIPKILKVIQEPEQENIDDMWEDLEVCPHCGAPTEWNESGVELCCTNPNCKGIKLAKIVFFFTTVGAENMGEETLSKIYDAGFTTIPQILQMTANDLLAIDGFGDGITDIILNNNKKIMEGLDMATLMHASDCFAGIGKIKAQKILDDMTDDWRKCFYDRYWVLPSKEEESYNKLSKTMQAFNDGVEPFFRFLSETGIPVLEPKKTLLDPNGPCKGMSVCVSGFRDPDLEEFVTDYGGKMVSGVSKKTTHLIVKDVNATSSKIEKARTLGVKIMSIDDFYNATK